VDYGNINTTRKDLNRIVAIREVDGFGYTSQAEIKGHVDEFNVVSEIKGEI
jgi:hypothetical protein